MNARKWVARLLAAAAAAYCAHYGTQWMDAAGDAFADRRYLATAAWALLVVSTLMAADKPIKWLWRTWVRALFVPSGTGNPTFVIEISGDVADEAALREAIAKAVRR